jgi:hypothetical protein
MAKYIKGLNKDTAPIDQPEGSYRYAKNMLSNETAGAISNEPGNRIIKQLFGADELVIGSIETTEDQVILYTVDSNGDSTIYIYNATEDTLTSILQTTSGATPGGNDFDLKFNKQYPIEGTYKIDPDQNLIVYWTDNLNPPRSLNVTRQADLVSTAAANNGRIYGVDPATSPNKNYVDRLNLFPHAGPVPSISFSRIANGGALKSGTYTLFLAYVDKNFTQTNFVSYSLAVPIVEDDESVRPIERYDGCEPDTQTGKSIVWEVSNLNTDYEFLRPIVVHRTLDEDSAPAEFAFKLNDIDINSNSGTIVFSGLEGYSSTSVEDAIIDTVAYDTAKTLTQLDSVLYLGNLTGTRDIGYQKYANFIKLTTIVSDPLQPFDSYELTADNLDYGYLDTEPDPSIVKNMGFRDVNNLSSANQNIKGYTRDEVYAFYIAFVLNDGSMSYAYHIPGRAALEIDSDDAALVRKADQDPNTGVSILATLPDFDEKFDLNDPDLIDLTQGQGKLFHFYDFSIFGGARNMNFWENKNEFYPDTDDYEMIDANNPGAVVEDLRGSNVRHHHMPCNTNSGREVIVNNTGTFEPAADTYTETYYFAVGDCDPNTPGGSAQGGVENGAGGGQSNDNLLMNHGTHSTTCITSYDYSANNESGWPVGYDNAFDYISTQFGNYSTWQYQAPSQSLVGVTGYYMFADGPDGGINTSGGTSAIVTEYLAGTDQVRIDQTPPNEPYTEYGSGGDGEDELPGQTNYAIFVWQVTYPAVTQNGFISHEVQALGIRLQDIKIPKTIADKVQGFRIYYAERKHENRRVLGQDLIKRANDADGWDIAGCGSGNGSVTGNGSTEDFILSPGSLYDGTVNTATFHDFYLLNRRNSLVPATHTSKEYFVDVRSFLGPGDRYADVNDDLTDECLLGMSYPAMHIGTDYFNFTANNQPFQHFPLREKCKTYLNGDSIYDGRGIGFGKRVYNVGGESSILLAYTPNRTPIYNFTPAGGGAVWHQTPSSGQGFSYENHTMPRMELHNLNAFKTDMYLSYDTQELIWTGFEVLGDELDNYTVEDDNTSTPGATHNTGDIFGGDTFICRHGYRITHRPEVAGTQPRDHKSIFYTICESTDNINFRHETDRDSSYFPGSPARKILALKAEIDLTKKDNMKYDESFSLGIADIKPAIPYPLREPNPSIFKTRVQRSAKADNTSLIDNYRVFLAFQFKDLPRNRGDLWKLISLNNLLYLHTEDSLFKTKGKQSLQLSDGTESFVGGGDIFAQDPDEVIQTKYGYGGTQSQWVSMVTKSGYFCMDYRNRRVFLMKDQMYDIGKTGLESWFQDNIPYALEPYGLDTSIDNPIIGIGFHAEYDERYDRILLTKRDLKPTDALLTLLNNATDNTPNSQQTIAVYNEEVGKFQKQYIGHTGSLVKQDIEFDDTDYFTPTGWTVSYDIELNVWVSFHDYIPYKYTRSRDVLVSFNEGNKALWGHDSETNRGRFYGVNYASEFEFIYNAAKDSDKVIYSFEYTVDVVNSSGSNLHDHGFSSFYVYNTHQISDERTIEYMINTRRVGNEWKINKFRDLALLQQDNSAIYTGPFTGSNFGVPGANVAGTNTTSVRTTTTNSMFTIDGMNETINNAFIDLAKSWDQQRKFTDKWVGIRLKYDNVTKKLINLYSTDVAAKKFYR